MSSQREVYLSQKSLKFLCGKIVTIYILPLANLFATFEMNTKNG